MDLLSWLWINIQHVTVKSNCYALWHFHSSQLCPSLISLHLVVLFFFLYFDKLKIEWNIACLTSCTNVIWAHGLFKTFPWFDCIKWYSSFSTLKNLRLNETFHASLLAPMWAGHMGCFKDFPRFDNRETKAKLCANGLICQMFTKIKEFYELWLNFEIMLWQPNHLCCVAQQTNLREKW